MRNQILVALLGIAAMLAGCSQEDGTLAPSENKTASFTVALDDGVVTRAGTETPTRYIMEVYEAETSTGEAHATQTVQSSNTFNVTLKNNQDYTILFWADYGTVENTSSANEYDASDLRAVKVADGKVATKAAFAGAKKFKVGTGEIPSAITLQHAVAQVNFMQKAETALTATPQQLVVKYPESYKLNVEDNAATKIEGAVTHTLVCNAVTTGTIATEYIVAGNTDNATIITPIEATLDSETKKEISNAPFRRNYATNISGAYSDKYSATLTASCEADWTGNNDKDLAEVSGYAVGDPYPNAETPIGVVYWLDDKDASYNASTQRGTKGKMVSLDELKCNWGPSGVDESASVEGIRSEDDGATSTKNLITARKNEPNFATNYPAFNWIYQTKNNGDVNGAWYMPAPAEMTVIGLAIFTNGFDNFNSKLSALGGTPIGVDSKKYYFTTTEYDQDKVYSVTFDSYDGEAMAFDEPKVQQADGVLLHVRAISDFNQSN